ncbi:MAG: metallopeptidase family protein [Nocardioidaceae bacterium]
MMDVSREAFDGLVADALDTLPAEIAAVMDNVAIFVEDGAPGRDNLLGLYEGVPLTSRDTAYVMAVPDRITIYRVPILRVSASPDDVRRQVQITVVHEIAHHFGIDDERLHELGYA